MLNVFTLVKGRLFQEEIESLEALARFQPIWVDLESPTLEERRWVKPHFGLSIPEDAMDDDIEESARFFEEDNGELHVRSDFLIDDLDNPHAIRVAFILNEHNDTLKSHGVLFSIHDEDVPMFRLLRMRARRMPGLIDDAKDVLLMLFDADADAEYCADTLEDICDNLETVSRQVLRDRRHRQPGALGHCAPRRPVGPHPAQRDGHAPRGQFHDAQPPAQYRAVRRRAPNFARPRLARQPHRVFVRQDQLPDGRHGGFHQHQPEQDHQDFFGGQRCAAAALADRQRLRHEFQVHARAGLASWLSVCAGIDDFVRCGSDAVFPQAGLVAVTPGGLNAS
jgi:Mg2+ and Co2+ transporter CorA